MNKKISVKGKKLSDFPEILAQWHPIKNEGVDPENLAASSGEKYWWKCEKGHKWPAKISHRTRGSNCPYCSNQKVCHDNCLATLYPEIAAQWHPIKNGSLTPKDVLSKTHKKVWWQCEKRHEWIASITNRTNLGRGCPYCNESKGEKKIREHLDLNSMDHETEFIVKIGRFDFVLPKKRLIIEYNGEQHYRPVSFGSKKKYAAQENLIDNIRRDYRKYQWCKKYGFDLLIIPYWELDRIDEILAELDIDSTEIPDIVKEYEPHRKKIMEELGIEGSEILWGRVE